MRMGTDSPIRVKRYAIEHQKGKAMSEGARLRIANLVSDGRLVVTRHARRRLAERCPAGTDFYEGIRAMVPLASFQRFSQGTIVLRYHDIEMIFKADTIPTIGHAAVLVTIFRVGGGMFSPRSFPRLIMWEIPGFRLPQTAARQTDHPEVPHQTGRLRQSMEVRMTCDAASRLRAPGL